MINQTIFTSVINNLCAQYDRDFGRAKTLSEIYGSDIDPVDNSLLSDAIFTLLTQHFNPEQLEDIKRFCYDQNFGRLANLSIGDLWNSLVKTIDVVSEYSEFLSPGEIIEWTLRGDFKAQTYASAIIHVDVKNRAYIVDASYGLDRISFDNCKLFSDKHE